ncbi:MAG: VOC family protein [Chitinophagaceae bacterium]
MSEETFKGRYNTVMPYLIVNNASKFIDFMKEVFNAKETSKTMRDESIIMHAEVKVGDSTIMFADATEQFKMQNAGMFICVDDADATFNKAIANGAKVITAMSDQNYGRTGGVKDPFENTWWITKVN